MNFEASSEEGAETEGATRDEIPETVTSLWRQMTLRRERGGLATTKIAAQVDGGGESIILVFCLTDPL